MQTYFTFPEVTYHNSWLFYPSRLFSMPVPEHPYNVYSLSKNCNFGFFFFLISLELLQPNVLNGVLGSLLFLFFVISLSKVHILTEKVHK